MSEHDHEAQPRRDSRAHDVSGEAPAVTASDAPAAHLLALQSAAGNAAVAGMLQPSLRVGASSDPLELEADRIADEVARAPGVPAASARKVRPARAAASRAAADDTPPPEGPGGPAGGAVDRGFERDLQQARSGGTPLPPDLRTSMEGAFGTDFGHVRLHDGPDAAGMADTIGARAFTTGADIFLGATSPGLDSDAGTHLLAHELTHVVQQSGAADTALRRDEHDAAPPATAPAPDAAPARRALPLLEVVEKLVDDLTAHRRGFLIDLQPRKLLDEIAAIDAKLAQLKARADELKREIDLIDRSGPLMSDYALAVGNYDALKAYWFASSTEMYKKLHARKKEIEATYGVRGRANLRAAVTDLRGREAEICDELARIQTVMARTELLLIEVKDRSLAFGLQLEEHARAAGHPPKDATFPFGGKIPEQLTWIETWSKKLPDVAGAAAKHLEAAETALADAEEVRKTEADYAFHELSHKKLVEEYAFLAKPGASTSQSIKITFTVGTGVEFGFFVQVSGSVATGDDRKVRPSLSIKVGATAKIDLGLWEVAASIGVSFGMTEGYDSLEHFAAHYMRILSLYNGSFQRYAQLKGSVDAIPKNAADYTEQRNRVIAEARKRGTIGMDDTVEVGTEDQRKLAELQAKDPIQIRSVTGDVGVGVGPTDKASGAASYLGGFNFSASYTRKWFTRLVDYDKFVAANGDVDGELARLEKVRADYCAMLTQLDSVRRDKERAVFGIVPPILIERENELVRLKNLYEEGSLTFFRRGRKAFLAELDEHITALRTQEDAEDSDDGVGPVDDVRAVAKKSKKQLTKTGSVWEVAIDGSFKVAGIGVKLAGKFNKITNDANPDNDGMYLNFSLEGGTDMTAEVVDPESDAGQKALQQIAESGEFKLDTIEPTASAVTATFVKNLAGGTQSVGGVLAGGVKIEGNLVYSNGAFRTQYVRITRSRSMSLTVKAKTGVGPNVEFGYSGGRTDFVAEWLGNNTLTYVQTIYDGLQGHPDPAGEWGAYVAAHREDLWRLMVASLTYTTNARAELLALPGGSGIERRYFEQVSSLRHQAGMDKPPPLDHKLFDAYLVDLQGAFDKVLATRGSLDVADLSKAGWSSAEGAVDSRVRQKFDLDTMTPTGRPEVASKSLLTRAVKGATPSIDDFSRYGSYANLVDAGATLELELATKGKTLTVEFDAAVDFPKALGAARAQLAAWIPKDSQAALTGFAGTDDIGMASYRFLDAVMRAPVGARPTLDRAPAPPATRDAPVAIPRPTESGGPPSAPPTPPADPTYTYSMGGAANPALWFHAATNTYTVATGSPGAGHARIEQFCGFLSLHWLTNGAPAGGLTFGALDDGTRRTAVDTLRGWASRGGRAAQVTAAQTALNGASRTVDQVTADAATYPVGTRIWFGNDAHAEAATVTAPDTFLMYDPNTGAATTRTAARFVAYVAAKNAFVVATP